MIPEAQAAINQANQIKARLTRVFANTPDDKLNWSPAPTARTPLALVAHCGNSLGFITDMLQGTPYPVPTMAEADKGFIEMEKEVTTREQATALLEKGFQRYIDHLGTVTEDQLDNMIEGPFQIGQFKLRDLLAIGAYHTQDHTAQLEYLQTCYGDRNW